MSPNDSQFIGHDRCIGRKLFEQKKLQIKLPVEIFFCYRHFKTSTTDKRLHPIYLEVIALRNMKKMRKKTFFIIKCFPT